MMVRVASFTPLPSLSLLCAHTRHAHANTLTHTHANTHLHTQQQQQHTHTNNTHARANTHVQFRPRRLRALKRRYEQLLRVSLAVQNRIDDTANVFERLLAVFTGARAMRRAARGARPAWKARVFLPGGWRLSRSRLSLPPRLASLLAPLALTTAPPPFPHIHPPTHPTQARTL